MNQHENNRYRPLMDEDYRDIADESVLKGLLRVREVTGLAQDVSDAREVLQRIQTRILQRAWRYPVHDLPLILCRSPAHSGANFIRWRNYESNCSGTLAWQALMRQPDTSQAVREALLAIECDRIVFNAQMSMVTCILRQLRECTEKLKAATTFSQSISPPSTQRR